MIGKRIREVRKHVGKRTTQADFAKLINYSTKHICLLEVGTAKPSRHFLDAICTTFQVNRDWLETGEGPMFRPREVKDRLPVVTEEQASYDATESDEVAEYMAMLRRIMTSNNTAVKEAIKSNLKAFDYTVSCDERIEAFERQAQGQADALSRQDTEIDNLKRDIEVLKTVLNPKEQDDGVGEM